jgi:hypothetical protein
VSVPAAKVGTNPVYVACELARLAATRWRSTILLNDKEAASKEFSADLGDGALVAQKLGGDLNGQKNAAFTLAEMLLMKMPLTDMATTSRAQLTNYFKQRYQLPL